ncbi:hypothetical protein DFH08DRAFT_806588 [Mycena albidolilacea]|uniref:Uncharacterized protein n=1 Tax=Mycena albidolilacea TaxID=1033008 RepID=A0AAD7A7D4_9AGAR|nr:hypothetical protein DFH08DRAFT_806588 [Mycena albidolilacea]
MTAILVVVPTTSFLISTLPKPSAGMQDEEHSFMHRCPDLWVGWYRHLLGKFSALRNDQSVECLWLRRCRKPAFDLGLFAFGTWDIEDHLWCRDRSAFDRVERKPAHRYVRLRCLNDARKLGLVTCPRAQCTFGHLVRYFFSTIIQCGGCILAVDGSQVPCLKAPPCLPLYGYVLNSTNTGDFTSPGSVPDCQDSAASVSSGPVRGANKTPAEIPAPKPQGWWGQQIHFSSIVSSGALVKNSNGTKDMQEPEVSRWTVVSYDDPSSLADKAAFAKSNGSHLIKSVSSLRAFF